MLSILSNMILVTSIFVILDAPPSPIIKNILWQGTYILVIVIMSDAFLSINNNTLFHSFNPNFYLVICITHWLVNILVRSFTLIYDVINPVITTWFLVYYGEFVILLILLGLCTFSVSSFISNIYSMIFFDILKNISYIWFAILFVMSLWTMRLD